MTVVRRAIEIDSGPLADGQVEIDIVSHTMAVVDQVIAVPQLLELAASTSRSIVTFCGVSP